MRPIINKYLLRKNKNNYVVLDIESSGGAYNQESIIEIAIYKFDGYKVVDRLISLINPEKKIDSYVQRLTGITDNMVRRAPKFQEIAKRIVEFTEGCIIVAHDAKADYRLMRLEYSRLGYEYERETLCTFMLSKKLIPEAKSYSLGKLTKSLGIPIRNRHRADGDAEATVKLFKILLDKDKKDSIVKQSISSEHGQQLSINHLNIIEEMPIAIGVYYIYDTEGKLLYINKTKNIKKRINQLLVGTNELSVDIQKRMGEVTYRITGNELIAMIKMQQEISNLKPQLNKYRNRKRPVKETKISYPEQNMMIIEKGRNTTEQGVILIKDGYCKGYAYCELAHQLQLEILETLLTPIYSNKKIVNAIEHYLNIKKKVKIINLKGDTIHHESTAQKTDI